MEVVGAVVGAVAGNLVSKLSAVIDKIAKEFSQLDTDIRYLRTQFAVIAAKIDEQEGEPPSALLNISMTTMRDLVFDIEDCLDQFLPCAACNGGAVSYGDLSDFSYKVGNLKVRLKNAKEMPAETATNNGSQQAAADLAGPALGAQDAPISVAANLVGIEEPKKEILDLLGSDKLTVISIVGFGGSGKTELASAVFHCEQVRKNFHHFAWYTPSKIEDGNEVLLAILRKLFPELLQTGDQMCPKSAAQMRSEAQERIKNLPENTRCLIVVDDIRMHHWEAIKSFFSELRIIRILLTTTMQTVANGCTGDGGYIYNMRTLSVEHSKALLKKKVGRFSRNSADFANGSDAIVSECHGHPLALISVANYLVQQRPITGKVCRDTSRRLCTLMDKDKDESFTELLQVLENNYISLPAHLKTCLLYTSLFPNDRHISRKIVTSRWLAEGYIGDQDAADENFKKLMDRNIIQPMDASNSGKAKTCKPHGIMHKFMLYKSNSSNFISTSLQKRRHFRHLIIEHQTNKRASAMDHGTNPAARHLNLLKVFPCSCFKPSTSTEEAEYPDTELLRRRSLTVFGSAEEAVYSDLINCKLMKVLDLKECENFKDGHIKNIYRLLHLKYLTLGSFVRELSGDVMKHLHCLETLDLRKTRIETLPAEVISLPHLAHLFGKIKLNKVGSKNRKKSNLQTLSGVIVDSNSGFPELLMEHMKILTKVKIWCEITNTDSNYTILSDAIHKFSKAGMDISIGARSLSLHLNDSSQDLLRQHNGYLSALKLQGRPSEFGEFVKSLSGLEELCLTSTNLTEDDLPALRTLERLVCLKLVEDDLEGLHIEPEDFQSLQRLCLVVPEPKFPRIAEGALPGLVSLQLLCKGLAGLCNGINVKCFEDLNEVALDSEVNQRTIEIWETEAKEHPKRPKVLLLKRVEAADTRSAVKYVAIDPSKLLVQGTP